ncbi:MAG TPA: TonB-dependent receptor [Porticoccaceae bacterium]
MIRKALYSVVSVCAFTTIPTSWIHAQETSDSGQTVRRGAAGAMIEEVLVTARKRAGAEGAQSVPITISAVSGEQIEAMFATNLTDVGMSMPNVRLDDSGAFAGGMNFTVRGMGFNSSIASVEPTVGLFVDGMYVGANLGSFGDTFDTESVEVLRGPQGTLFGRNVTGGAVVMNSRRPTGEFGGVLRGGVGSGGRMMTGVGVEGPLTETLAGKIYAQYSDRDGDFDNVATGKDHGEEEVTFVRPMARWQASSGLTIDVIGEYGKHKGEGNNGRFVEVPGEMLYEQGARAPRATDKLSLNYDGFTEVEWKQLVVDANWEVAGGTFTSVTGYRDVSYASAIDSDATALETAHALNVMDQDQFSQELCFNARALDERLDYTIGLYYFEQEVDQLYHVFFFGSSNQRSRGTLKHHTASLFAQGDYELLSNVYLTLGGRYTWEEKKARNARTPDCDLALNCILSDTGKETWSNFTPKVGLSWQASEDLLFYGSWSRGFRSGGYNIRTTGTNESAGPYDEEEVEAWELGMKSEWWNGRARVNAAIFRNQYEELQRTVNLGLVNFISNVAEATVEGVELDITLLPTDNLAVNFAVGYLDAEYDSYPALDVNGDGVPDPDLAKGLKLIRAPEWSYSASVIYDMSLGDAGNVSTRIAYTYNDETPANDANTYFTPDWEVWDASITWTPASGDNLRVSLWGKNLGNENYALLSTVVGGIWTNDFQALPRHYGLEVSYRF